MPKLMSNRQILKNAIPDPDHAIFSAMPNAPWYDSVAAPGIKFQQCLDHVYLRQRSGFKYVSPLVYNYMGDNIALDSTGVQILAAQMWAIYGNSWNRLWNAYTAEYNPLENYRMSEEHADTTTRTGTETEIVARTGSDVRTTELGTTISDTRAENEVIARTGSDTRTTSLGTTISETGTIDDEYSREMSEESSTETEGVTENGVYGFNSVLPVQSTKSNQTGSSSQEHDVTKDDGLNTRTLNTRRVGSGSDTETIERDTEDEHTRNFTNRRVGSGSDVETLERGTEDEHERTSELTDENEGSWTRHGALGFSTFQRMLQEERNLWMWDFFERVFQDCDKLLTIPVMNTDVIIRSKYYEIGEI